MKNKLLGAINICTILRAFTVICIVLGIMLLLLVKPVEAKADTSLPFQFTRPHITKITGGVLIEYRAPILMRSLIYKNNKLLYDKITRAGNIRVYDRNYHTGDTYTTQVMYCAPLNEIPGRHCYYTGVYGPFTPDNWYWTGWLQLKERVL